MKRRQPLLFGAAGYDIGLGTSESGDHTGLIKFCCGKL